MAKPAYFPPEGLANKGWAQISTLENVHFCAKNYGLGNDLLHAEASSQWPKILSCVSPDELLVKPMIRVRRANGNNVQ